MVLLAWLRIVPDHGFLIYLAFRGSSAVLLAANHLQAGFPAVPNEDDPAQTVSLRGISLSVGHRCGGLALAIEILVCAAVASILAVCVHPPCVGVAVFQSAWRRELSSVLALLLWWTPLRFSGYTHAVPAPAVLALVRPAAAPVLIVRLVCPHVGAEVPVYGLTVLLLKHPRILSCQDAGAYGAGGGQLHGQFHGRSFLPVRLRLFPRRPNGQTALRCHSALLQTSVPSGAAQSMQLDVSAACLSVGRFVLEYQE